MNFNDTLKYDLAVFSSIFPNRAAVLNQLFCVNGNGYEWGDDGDMQERSGNVHRYNELVAIEQWVGAGKHKEFSNHYMEEIPEAIRRRLLSFNIPVDIEERLSKTDGYSHWYPMSPGYNALEKLPDNIPTDWLNAAWECANLIIAAGIDMNDVKQNARMYRSHCKSEEESVEQALNCAKMTLSIATQALERMTAQFPNHKFENNPIPTFDANRKMPKTGIIPWALDESPADFSLCIDPFKKAIKFAYSLRRKNAKKDIPYRGLPLGHDERVCSFGPEERFLVGNMEYDKNDQGRDALDVILCCMAQICIEQGRRIAKQDLVDKCLGHYFYDQKFRKMADERSKTDPVFAARLRFVDQMSNSEGPIVVNQDDPHEVQAYKEFRGDMDRLLEDLDKPKAETA